MEYNAGSTFDSIKDVVDSVESSFDSVYETVKSWEPASAPTPGDDELADDTDEEGQVELLAPAEAPGPERRRALLQDDAYYSDYLAAAPDAAVEDFQRAVDLDGEIDVAGCIDDVNVRVVPRGVGCRGGDCDTPLLLQFHVIHGRTGATTLDLFNFVNAAGVEEDSLAQGCLARVDVSGNADIS
mgnify:CR=1 FL=1